MTPETAPLWILAWITLGVFAFGTAKAARAWIRRSAALAGVTAVFALGMARQIGLLLSGAGGRIAFDARTGAEIAFLGIAIAGFVALRANRRTTRERDRAEDLHWDSMETVRMMTELASGPDSDFQTRLGTLLALGAERFELELGVAWRLDGEGGGAIAIHPPTAGDEAGRLSSDLLRRAANATRPVALIDASRDHPRTFFGTSVRSEGRIHGSLAFEGRGGATLRFTATDKDLLNLMAQWLATELDREAAAEAAPALRAASLRRVIGRPERSDLNAAVHHCEAKLRRRLGVEATLELRLDPAAPAARPTRVSLATLVESLVEAAAQLAPAGRIRVETKSLAGASDSGSGDVTLEVRVEGKAVDADTLQRILEAGDDTGEPGAPGPLPLSRLEGLLRRSGGDLSVSLEPGRNAQFTAFLPSLAQAGASQTSMPSDAASANASVQPS